MTVWWFELCMAFNSMEGQGVARFCRYETYAQLGPIATI